jgi:hypothetical protein
MEKLGQFKKDSKFDIFLIKKYLIVKIILKVIY